MNAGARVLTRWFGLSDQARDAVLAAVVTVATQVELTVGAVEGSLAQQRVSFLAMTAAVVWRRSVPLLAAVVLSVGMVVQTLAGPAPVVGGFIAALIVTYSLGAHSQGRLSVVGLLVVLAGVHVYPLVDPERANLADEVGNLAIFVGVWALGGVIRLREARAEQLRGRAVAAETDRDERVREALSQERARLAGELHDLVAHGVSVMVLQAGAGRQALDHEPDRTRTALLAIESTGRQALDEMHRLLGLLSRDDDGAAPVDPPVTLAGLDELLDQVRAAGLTAQAHIAGERRPLAPGLELSAYRIIQESLTNTLKHAQAQRVDVRLDYQADSLLIEVTDDGLGRGSSRPRRGLAGTGHGTISMRERVTMFGGDLHLGPGPDGGWRVAARLPTRPS
jgi:signal transduction histidine kinase